MKPINVYRRATEAGLQIDLSEGRTRLLVWGKRSGLDKHMPLLRRHRVALLALLMEADNQAAAAITKAKHSQPTRTNHHRHNNLRRQA